MPAYISRTSTSSSLRDAEAAPLWDPRTTLQIESDCRCVGYAPSKRRKCLNPIAGFNLTKANTLLHDISTQQPDADALHSKLRRLAEYLLCVRYHQGQARDMVDKWSDRMEAAYPLGVVETTRRRSSPRRTNLSGSRSSSSSSVSVPAHSEMEALQETITAMQEALRVAERRLAALDYRSPSSSQDSTPAVSRVSTSDISSLNLSRTSTSESSSSARSHNSTSSHPRSSPHLESTTAQSSTIRCPRTRARHVRRRAIDEECPICQEEFEVDEALVWCKDSCGRTVHRECFEAWRASRTDDGERVTCAICRAVWGPECGCDD